MRDPLAEQQQARAPHAFRLPGGEALTVRSIRPHDAPRLQTYVRALAPESRRNRFLGAVNELAPTQLDRFANMVSPGELALMAVVGGGAMVGEAVQVVAPGGSRCEIALSVAEGWRRRGLGTLLLRNLECRARLLGVGYLFGDVLRTNDAMLCLARKAGFSVFSPFTDARQCEIVKDLSAPQTGVPCREQFVAAAAAA